MALILYNAGIVGFHCVPGFTHRFKQWSIDNETEHKSHGGLVNVPRSDPIRNEVRQIHVRMGSFIVWDSRLPHGTFYALSKLDGRATLSFRIHQATFQIRAINFELFNTLHSDLPKKTTRMNRKLASIVFFRANNARRWIRNSLDSPSHT